MNGFVSNTFLNLISLVSKNAAAVILRTPKSTFVVAPVYGTSPVNELAVI